MDKNMTVTDMILEYLEENGSITPLQALREFGCLRLSAAIFKLRERGYIIHTTYVTKKNKFGKPVSFAKYVVEYEGDEK